MGKHGRGLSTSAIMSIAAVLLVVGGCIIYILLRDAEGAGKFVEWLLEKI